jgi:hypothetical protein
VKNITLSASEALIERARLRAAREGKALNGVFREWLDRYAGTETSRQEYMQLMKRWRHIKSGRRFSREEMNER